jgi:hypothetical protein
LLPSKRLPHAQQGIRLNLCAALAIEDATSIA